jgi:hypothetical protein
LCFGLPEPTAATDRQQMSSLTLQRNDLAKAVVATQAMLVREEKLILGA